jgi:hypothetical protein
MTPLDFDALLEYGESTWLDWKREYPAGLLGDKTDPNRPVGRAELIKDLSAIANGEDDRTQGFLVYGVKDLGGSRKIFGVPAFLDDADIQSWVKPYLDPPVTFTSWPIVLQSGESILLLEVTRVPQYPHVIAQNLGQIIYKGQVWWRSGSQNDVALHSRLSQMFRGTEPTKLANVQGTVINEIKAYYEPLGYQVVLPLLADRGESLANGLEIAYRPGTRSEVWAGFWEGQYEHLVMLKRSSTRA